MMDSKNVRDYSFSVLCAKFIEHKRALGCKYDSEARIVERLMQFGVDFFKTSEMTKIHLTREFVEAWVERKPYEAPGTQ